MKKIFIVLAIVAAVALPGSAAFSQQKETPPSKPAPGMMEGMQGGGMMCPMMGMGGMGDDARNDGWYGRGPQDHGSDDGDARRNDDENGRSYDEVRETDGKGRDEVDRPSVLRKMMNTAACRTSARIFRAVL